MFLVGRYFFSNNIKRFKSVTYNNKRDKTISYHHICLKQDIINTIINTIHHITRQEILHEVINRGFKKQRIYVDDEILEILENLLEQGYIIQKKDKYEWKK